MVVLLLVHKAVCIGAKLRSRTLSGLTALTSSMLKVITKDSFAVSQPAPLRLFILPAISSAVHLSYRTLLRLSSSPCPVSLPNPLPFAMALPAPPIGPYSPAYYLVLDRIKNKYRIMNRRVLSASYDLHQRDGLDFWAADRVACGVNRSLRKLEQDQEREEAELMAADLGMSFEAGPN